MVPPLCLLVMGEMSPFEQIQAELSEVWGVKHLWVWEPLLHPISRWGNSGGIICSVRLLWLHVISDYSDISGRDEAHFQNIWSRPNRTEGTWSLAFRGKRKPCVAVFLEHALIFWISMCFCACCCSWLLMYLLVIVDSVSTCFCVKKKAPVCTWNNVHVFLWFGSIKSHQKVKNNARQLVRVTYLVHLTIWSVARLQENQELE